MEPKKVEGQEKKEVHWHWAGNELLRRASHISRIIQERVRDLLEEEPRQQMEEHNKDPHPQ
jgi:hypothetical protein